MTQYQEIDQRFTISFILNHHTKLYGDYNNYNNQYQLQSQNVNQTVVHLNKYIKIYNGNGGGVSSGKGITGSTEYIVVNKTSTKNDFSSVASIPKKYPKRTWSKVDKENEKHQQHPPTYAATNYNKKLKIK
ncbi:hypothetical protein PPL_04561 [Heterostelium album PN500]|uniref:Uncharacterized protein n=1 Tax=Heterostelium pallidum (strain ATCC 26659 / Pp 5 / PN500) TaxID=670386 RepID=D3B7X3_HETP5|nr:hypothetical protein PPL_04561 [Heterostelium album PN500]EFA82141.1 hypothetical protein PPL_04561 [Heterostelium album PN500]|eukprot:XP_020434258.1 hypothetical protein PPL_04561 [Heterostelium album PN500]